ncbi:FAD-binding oxidoreductase [Caldivirga sp.]|uniref:FAD-binding oxidoreductase n=1 Tax=Caldivirga sp. TaxID=2080243 RepID=UPI003D0FA284
MNFEAFRVEVRKIINEDRIIESQGELMLYSYDASPAEQATPRMVIQPLNTGEVSEILKLANEYLVPIVPSSGRTSLHGGPIPYNGAVVVDLMRMNKVLEVNLEDSYVHSEVGVRLDELNAELARYGHFFPPDPASSAAATVGGSLANGAGGMRGAKYGTVKDWVLGAEVVLPTGEVAFMGCRTLKCRAGYDLLSLIIGSEGTLGVITNAYLKIWPLPEAVARLRVYFRSIVDAARAVGVIKARGFRPLIIEFLDRGTMEAVSNYVKEFKYPEDAEAMLIIDIDGPPEAMDRYVNSMITLLGETGGFEIEWTSDRDEMDKIYMARRAAYPALLRLYSNERVMPEDISVPPSRLPEAVKGVRDIGNKYGLKIVTWGHVGDGNLHPNIIYNPSDQSSVSKLHSVTKEIGLLAINLGGTVSSEHGVGVLKKELLVSELGVKGIAQLRLMKAIKRAFDPNNVLNPGKVIDVD